MHNTIKTKPSPYSIKMVFVRDPRYASGRYKFWLVSGQDRKGQRVRKKFSEPGKAEEYKQHLDLNHWNEGAVMRPVLTKFSESQLTELDYCLSRLGDRYSLHDAVTFFLDHHRDISEPTSLAKAIDAFKADAEKRMRHRTVIQLRSTLRQFEEAADGQTFLHTITTETVQRFLTALRARNQTDPASAQTINGRRADLHSFFEWCRKKPRCWLTFNPAADIDKRDVDQGEIHILTAQQSQELMTAVEGFKGGRLARYFALTLFAGVRPRGEIEKLSRNEELISLANGSIQITAAIAKTARPRPITIQPNLSEWLSRYPAHILPAGSETGIKSIRKHFGLTPDILRHTFVSMHLKAFGSFADTAIESGNSEKIIRDHYLNVTTQTEASAFWKIAPAAK